MCFIECKKDTDRPRESQREWERKTGNKVIVFYYPDKDSSQGYIFIGWDEFDKFLANPIEKPMSNRLLDYAFTLEYGKAKIKEQHDDGDETTEVQIERIVPAFNEPVYRGRETGKDSEQRGASGGDYVPFRER